MGRPAKGAVGEDLPAGWRPEWRKPKSRGEVEPVHEAVRVDGGATEVRLIDERRGLILANMTAEKIAAAPLNQQAVAYGVLTDKRMLLEGKATMIVGHENRQSMVELASGLIEEFKRRGIKPKVIEGDYSEVDDER